MRRFGRRGFRTRRRFGVGRRARRLGSYEMLFNTPDTRDINGAFGRGFVFPTGLNGVQSFATATQLQAEQPPLQQLANQAQAIRFNPSGFTIGVNLWDTSLNNKWQEDATLASLRGYLRPVGMTNVNGADTQSDTAYQIRLAIAWQTVAEWEATVGDVSSAIPQNVWSIGGQRQRILWQRDWVVVCNPTSTKAYQYWGFGTAAGGGSKDTGNEPRLASSQGSDLVRLKRCGRIVRGRWPILLIGVRGSMPAAFTAAAASGALTLTAGTTLTVFVDGWLKGYLQR